MWVLLLDGQLPEASFHLVKKSMSLFLLLMTHDAILLIDLHIFGTICFIIRLWWTLWAAFFLDWIIADNLLHFFNVRIDVSPWTRKRGPLRSIREVGRLLPLRVLVGDHKEVLHWRRLTWWMGLSIIMCSRIILNFIRRYNLSWACKIQIGVMDDLWFLICRRIFLHQRAELSRNEQSILVCVVRLAVTNCTLVEPVWVIAGHSVVVILWRWLLSRLLVLLGGRALHKSDLLRTEPLHMRVRIRPTLPLDLTRMEDIILWSP